MDALRPPRRRVATDRPWRASSFVYPERIPTMISREERQYLWWLAADVWEDAGHIVEMGPWLGGSTACLAEGLRTRAGEPVHRLHTIDNFVWRTFMSDRADLKVAPGESFEGAFRANVECYGNLVATTCAWLPDETIAGDRWAAEVRGNATGGDLFRWEAGPAEIVFVDGAKSWAGLAHLLNELSPSLTDGALLVFQDYKYWGSYWVPMMSELLAERLELVHILPENTVAFRVALPLPVGRVDSLPAAEVGSILLEQAASRLDAHGDPLGATVVRLSSVRFLAHSGETDAAVEALRRVVRKRPQSTRLGDVSAVRDWLEAFAERPVPLPRRHSRHVMRSVRKRVGRVARKTKLLSRNGPHGRRSEAKAD